MIASVKCTKSTKQPSAAREEFFELGKIKAHEEFFELEKIDRWLK